MTETESGPALAKGSGTAHNNHAAAAAANGTGPATGYAWQRHVRECEVDAEIAAKNCVDVRSVKFAWILISTYVNGEGKAEMAQTTLARQMHVSPDGRLVGRSIKTLVEMGALTVQRRGGINPKTGRHRTAIYTLRTPDTATSGVTPDTATSGVTGDAMGRTGDASGGTGDVAMSAKPRDQNPFLEPSRQTRARAQAARGEEGPTASSENGKAPSRSSAPQEDSGADAKLNLPLPPLRAGARASAGDDDDAQQAHDEPPSDTQASAGDAEPSNAQANASVNGANGATKTFAELVLAIIAPVGERPDNPSLVKAIDRNRAALDELRADGSVDDDELATALLNVSRDGLDALDPFTLTPAMRSAIKAAAKAKGIK